MKKIFCLLFCVGCSPFFKLNYNVGDIILSTDPDYSWYNMCALVTNRDVMRGEYTLLLRGKVSSYVKDIENHTMWVPRSSVSSFCEDTLF